MSVEGVLDDPDIDAIVNLTPPKMHADVDRATLAAGKSVFSEKPLGITFAEGSELVDLAAQAELRLGCAPDTFLGAGLQTCRAIIDRGDIGEPLAANAFMLSPGPERWHPSPSIFYEQGAGPLFDMGPVLPHCAGSVARAGAPHRARWGAKRVSSARSRRSRWPAR